MIISALGFHHLSTGQLLRAEVAKGSDLGRQVADVMAAGDLVSDKVVMQLLRDNLTLWGEERMRV